MDYKKYLQENHFISSFNKLKKKLRNKRILLYGAGEFFNYIYNNFDFSDLNIIGISDKSFENTNKTFFNNIKIIAPFKINECKPDYVILSILNWQNVLYDNYQKNIFSQDLKILPIINTKISTFENNIQLKFARKIFSNYPNYFTYQYLHKLIQKEEDKNYLQIQKNYNIVQKRLNKTK